MSLLVFSLIFYAWGEPKYVLLLMFMSLCSWFCALRVERAASRKGKRAWVAVSCAIDIALIGFFKYAGLICSVFGEVPEFIANIALPIGISFYTFQLLTYVVDVYRGDAEAQPSYLNVLLYASLFHQCVAGPIVRYKTIAHELFVQRDSRDLLSGISRFTVGLAKRRCSQIPAACWPTSSCSRPTRPPTPRSLRRTSPRSPASRPWAPGWASRPS